MSRGILLSAWGMLLVATLAVGGTALRLLQGEQQRLQSVRTAAAMELAETVAARIALALADLQDGLLHQLRRMPPDRLDAALLDWRDVQPLVRNVFVVGPDGVLRLPSPAQPATVEEAGFVQRFEGLFAGRAPWETPGSDQMTAPASQGLGSTVRRPRKLFSPARSPTAASADREIAEAAVANAGWTPWIWDNRLHLLGWVEQPGSRYGLELELIAVRSQLLDAIPEPSGGVGALAVLDDQGTVVHQRGHVPIDDRASRWASVQIGSALPHWQISVYRPSAAGFSEDDRAIGLMSTLMVAVLMTALLFGGSVLLWLAQRFRREAEQKTTFVSNVSHELKTPLTTIRMYAELMAEGRVVGDEKRNHYVQVIIQESHRLGRLVNNVLDFSRLDQGRKRYHLDEVDLAHLVRSVLETQRLRLDEAGMVRTIRLPDRPIPVRTDRDAVEQALLNLIDNAIKYAAAGADLTVELESEDDVAILRVCDRGPGIPAGQRKRIFERFRRLDDSLTSQSPGAGLGLTIARRLLRGLGGELTCQPRVGGGSRFCIHLPREANPPRPTA